MVPARWPALRRAGQGVHRRIRRLPSGSGRPGSNFLAVLPIKLKKLFVI
jgi:hypothetical protein